MLLRFCPNTENFEIIFIVHCICFLALLTSALGVTDRDFVNLPLLVTICSLSSLVTLPFIKYLDGVQTSSSSSNPSLPGEL